MPQQSPTYHAFFLVISQILIKVKSQTQYLSNPKFPAAHSCRDEFSLRGSVNEIFDKENIFQDFSFSNISVTVHFWEIFILGIINRYKIPHQVTKFHLFIFIRIWDKKTRKILFFFF